MRGKQRAFLPAIHTLYSFPLTARVREPFVEIHLALARHPHISVYSITMSDLAPFVAAALRDKTVTDLLEENESLRKVLEKRQLVEVTGPGGSPIYAEALMDEGEYSGGGHNWLVEMTHLVDPLPLDQLRKLEIRLGGVPLLEKSAISQARCLPLDFLDECYDEETGMGIFEVVIKEGHSVSTVNLRVGPFESINQYSGVYDEHRRHDGGEFLCSNLVEALESRVGIAVADLHVEFPISRMQQLLDTLGIPRPDMVKQRARTRRALVVALARAETGAVPFATFYRTELAENSADLADEPLYYSDSDESMSDSGDDMSESGES